MMKTKLYIFGDSFSVSNKNSWVEMLKDQYDVYNYSTNGSSEYRIWKNYQNLKKTIIDSKILFCHTSPTRIFLKNTETFSSRLLPSHPYCDLIFSDIHAKKEKKFQEVLDQIWDEDFFTDTYQLMLTNLLSIENSTHISFFDVNCDTSLQEIWKQFPGTINHLTDVGNYEVYKIVKNLL